MKRKRFLVVAALLVTATAVALGAQGRKKHRLPPPLRLFIPFEAAWDGMLETVREDMPVDVGESDKVTGQIITSKRDYIDGPLTESHIAKIGVPVRLRDATWKQVRYQYVVKIELIAERESVVTVDVDIEALKREFLGQESWVEIQSNGRLETQLLNAFGQRLFGSDFQLEEPKKGFWEHDPSYVPRPEDRVPTIASPERPPR
ncbi:MAG TPA: hypothetical protein VLV83_09765 [Acidobacteriota bacterium]|nr:hypothetical protein [Acidobacteriota bacterium]